MEVLLVEPAELNGSKVKGPIALADRLEAEVFEAEKVGDEDLPVLPADDLFLGDFVKLEGRGEGNVLYGTGD